MTMWTITLFGGRDLLPVLYSTSVRERAEAEARRREESGYVAVVHEVGQVPPAYRVVWDNGNGASGTFPYTFDTFDAANAYGEEWVLESNLRDLGEPDPSEGYSYEVIEVP